MNLFKTVDGLLKRTATAITKEFVLNKDKISLYFIGLEDDRMFLYMSYTKPEDQILEDCSKLYEYARVHPVRRVVFTIHDVDLFDADKYVKLFMQMFGIDNTRGGSYVDVILPDYQQKSLERELFTASADFVKDNNDALYVEDK
jgi:hypothetical protein